MVIALPEAITIEQQWPEILVRSVLHRQEAVYTENSPEPCDTRTKSSQRCFPQAGRERLGSVWVWGQRAS